MSNVDQYLIDQLSGQLQDAIEGREITPASIMGIATIAMAMVERQKNMSGDDKKALVIILLHNIVDATEMDDGDKAAVSLIIETTIPSAIDLLIDASKGGLDIDRIKSRWESIKSMFSCCCAK